MSDARSEARVVERLWYDATLTARAARLALLPLEALYAGAISVRRQLYDSGLRAAYPTPLPALSVGNLTVGGTGKTPVAAWLAGELRMRGARPAIVLRGYGADEPLVHQALNPDVPTVVSADRVAGAEQARARGADVVVLDDAFQHRRAQRVADVVLISADRWDSRRRRLLPAGPWREPLTALRRASLVVATRKVVSFRHADAVVAAALEVAPAVPTAVVHLAVGELRRASDPRVGADGGGDGEEGTRSPMEAASGRPVFAISAVADAGAFHAQLVAAGARLQPPPAAYPDHYAFTRDDAKRLAREAEAAGTRLVVCTLKDAVKLAPLWPRGAPALWYVSQRVVLERGRAAVDDLLARVLDARHAIPSGAALRPSGPRQPPPTEPSNDD